MARFRQGSAEAAAELVKVLHPELRRLAAAQMRRERMDHTWQPTALVNELYLELLKVGSLGESGREVEDEKRAFFGFAAHLMKRLLCHHARPLSRRAEKVAISDEHEPAGGDFVGVAEIEDLLKRLASVDPQLRTLVELKVFEGLTVEEIAAKLECAPRTVAREWNFARFWLRRELSGEGY